jgi:hypothetical protein
MSPKPVSGEPGLEAFLRDGDNPSNWITSECPTIRDQSCADLNWNAHCTCHRKWSIPGQMFRDLSACAKDVLD